MKRLTELGAMAALVSAVWGGALWLDNIATKDDVRDVRDQHLLDATSQQIYNYRQEQYQIEDRAAEVPLTFEERRRLKEIEEKRERAERRQRTLEQKMISK